MTLCRIEIKSLVFIIAAVLCHTTHIYGFEKSDTASSNWIKQLIAYDFHINEPAIRYPKFPRFCVNVYNWADRTFNSYDTAYVEGTGKNWKARLTSYNWVGNNLLLFSKSTRVHINSNIFSDIGPNISFMALNIGYMWNLNKLRGENDDARRTFNFGFNCALFSFNLNYSYVKGGTTIERFVDYNNGKRINLPYNDIKQEVFQVDACYYFNNRRYSQAASYTYSKYQLRSAGSWMLGVAITKQNNVLDFSNLPETMKPYLPISYHVCRINYMDYNIIGGYGYNWVFRPKWLLNATLLPSIGYKHSSSTEEIAGGKNMFATNLKSMMSLTYNHRSMFIGIISRFDGFVFYGKDYTYFNSLKSLTANIGFRF